MDGVRRAKPARLHRVRAEPQRAACRRMEVLTWPSELLGVADLNRRPLRPEAKARCGLPPVLLCLTCVSPSVDVLWRPLVSVAVVTELVTHMPRGAVTVVMS